MTQGLKCVTIDFMPMLYSLDLERQILALLIKKPSVYAEISRLVEAEDFYHKSGSTGTNAHRSIFEMIMILMKDGHDEQISSVILIERLKASGLTFVDDLKVESYINNSLGMMKVPDSSEGAIALAKELRNYRGRRDYLDTLESLKNSISSGPLLPIPDLVNKVDSGLSSILSTHGEGSEETLALFEDPMARLLSIADNPIGMGFEPPHLPLLTQMASSLLQPGNITVIAARTGVGKTTFALDYCVKTSIANEHIAVLHLDNGEMSADELFCRKLSALSGVREHFIKTGKWRTTTYLNKHGQEVTPEMMQKAIDKALPEVEKYNFQYAGVGGMTPEQKISLVKRHYHSKVGRNKPMILSYDYIKSPYTSTNANLSSWEAVGHEMVLWKNLIKDDITFGGKPCIAMLTSVQQNRSAIARNRSSENLINDASTISLSDQIAQNASYVGLLREVLDDEAQEMPSCYRGADGLPRMTHNLFMEKCRSGGEDYDRQSSQVAIPSLDDDGSVVGTARIQPNSVYLRFENFEVEEICDLRDVAQQMRTGGITPDEDGAETNWMPDEDGGDDEWL